LAKPKSREKIVEALLALCAERPFGDVTLSSLAERGGVTLAEIREHYDGRLDVLADYIRQVDQRVLAGVDPALSAEGPRERLFDILMARFEVHAPHKLAIRSIVRSARRDPVFALALNRLVAASMAWMLAAAGISTSGARGQVRAQGLALIWARVMRVWLHDEDPGLAATMAALDKRLREAERMVIRVQRLERCIPRRRRASGTEREVGGDGDIAEGHPT